MAAKDPANDGLKPIPPIGDQEPSTGALSVPEQPDASPASMFAKVMESIGDEPLVPKKRGRPKKVQPVVDLDDDDDAPPPTVEEPAEEPEPEPVTADTEATEGDEEPSEPTELEDQLTALAQNYGVDPELLSGAESVGEAERFINKMFSVFYREGAAQNGYAEPPQPIPAALGLNGAVQKSAADALELDFSKYDDDEQVKNDLKKVLDVINADRAEIAALKAEKTRAQEDEFRRVQQHVASQFQNEFFSASPELFGSEKKQDPRQAQRMRKAFKVADTLIRGCAAAGEPLPPVKAIAKWAVNAEFAEDLANQQITNKRVKVQGRMARRSIGAPAQLGRSLSSAPKAAPEEGPMEKRPSLLAAVQATLSRTRS